MIVEKGRKVSVHYTGTLEDGTVFDSSREREPLTFEQGAGMLIAGFEKAIEGKKAGESVTVTIPPEEAYGPYDPDQIFSVARVQVPDSIPLEIGTKLQLSSEQGVLLVSIKDVTEEEIVLDGNPELAGKTLTFAIDILSVE
ncbi:MAG: peptidylprolyl isomerase [Desulfovibrio sp.]|nr:peptidylprolyl isomerase [Desulfovibrio sp.]